MAEQLRKIWGQVRRLFTWCHRRMEADQVRRPRRQPRTAAPDKRRRAYKRELSSLLDGIDRTFTNLTFRAEGGSFTHPDTRAGLRALGPHVPIETLDEWKADWISGKRAGNDDSWPRVKIGKETKFSALMFISWYGGDERNSPEVAGHRSYKANFLYASRQHKLPWNVAPLKGDIFYECGAAWRQPGKKKLWWVGYYVSINSRTGEVQCARMLMQEQVQVSPRKSTCYTRKYWGVPYTRNFDPAGERSEDCIAAALADEFADLFNFWQRRNTYWQVGVRRGNRRVTFCVRPEETKHYFKNRDKTALTVSGKRRPIIHFVNEHQRTLTNGRVTTVKAHIRGLRQFDWNGYQCSVVAPQWHRLNSLSFNVMGYDEEDIGGVRSLPLSAVGRLIAEMEETQHVPKIH